MGRQIIKQPNGNYCVYSSVTESLIGWDIPKDKLIEFYVEEAAEAMRKNIVELINKIEAKEKPYHQFTLTWDEVKVHYPKK